MMAPVDFLVRIVVLIVKNVAQLVWEGVTEEEEEILLALALARRVLAKEVVSAVLDSRVSIKDKAARYVNWMTQ